MRSDGTFGSDLVVALTEFVYLTLRFVTGNSVAFLNSSDELIALAFNDPPIIIRQPPPFFLGFSDQLFPVSLHLVGVHPEPRVVVRFYQPCCPASGSLGVYRHLGTGRSETFEPPAPFVAAVRVRSGATENCPRIAPGTIFDFYLFLTVTAEAIEAKLNHNPGLPQEGSYSRNIASK
jgi:hypothetical protein